MRREYSPPDEITLAGSPQASVEESTPSIDAHTVPLVLSPGDDLPDPLRHVAFDRGRIPGYGADYCHAGDCHSERRG